MKSTSRIILLLSLPFFLLKNIQAQESNTTAMPHRVEIPNSQVLKLTSNIVAGQEYELHVNLPGGYASDTGKTYPVLFVLDGQWDFPLLAAIYGEQYFDGFIPGIITVGITWGGVSPNPDKLRARDFTPGSPDGSNQFGNAPKFLSFIKQELIPFIDSKYRTAKNEHALMGSSLGGLFTLYAFFNETQVFNKYILTSPALTWDNSILKTFEKDYSEKRSQVPVRLFIGVGALEPMASGVKEFADHLQDQHYKGLQMQFRALENIGHSGGKAEGYTRGLQFVFAHADIPLSAAVLDQYAGDYTLGSNTLKMTRENDHLVVMAGNNKQVLSAETEKDFYVKGTFLFLHMKKDDAGKVAGAQIELYGGQQYAKKVN